MASQRLFLQRTKSAPELNSTPLDRPFEPGQSISFVSTSYDPTADTNVVIDSAGIYLTIGNDVLLDIAVRRAENRILFNTRLGTTWGTEQSVRLQDVFLGPDAIIHVTATATTYNISFSNSSKIHTFPKVIQGNATGVLYFENNTRAVFSNPVVAAVFGVYIFLSALTAQFILTLPKEIRSNSKDPRGTLPHDATIFADAESSHQSESLVNSGLLVKYLRRLFPCSSQFGIF